jgi:Spy/CpxP family protein refolding chaperone
VSLSLAFAPNAFADKDHHPRKNEMRQLFKQLDLTQTQVQDVRQLMKQGHDDQDVIRQDMRQISKQLTALIQSSTWDQQAVETVLLQRINLTSQIGWQKASKKNQVWQLLTPEQQTEFARLTEQAKGKTKEGKGRRASKFLDSLELSDEQAAKIELIKADSKAHSTDYKTLHQEFRQAQQSLIQSTSLSESDWQTLALKYQDDKLAMALAKAQSRHNIWNVLNAEQQTQLMEKAQHRSDKKRGRHNDRI